MKSIPVKSSAQRARELLDDPEAYFAQCRADAHAIATNRRRRPAPPPPYRYRGWARLLRRVFGRRWSRRDTATPGG